MQYLFLSICCSLAIASIFKYNETRAGDRTALLTANYWMAACAAIVILGRVPVPAHHGLLAYDGFLILTLVTGGLFISTYFVLAWATDTAGMGLATGVMRVSVVVPVVASWVLWEERPSAAQMIGLLLAGAAFFCIVSRHDSDGHHDEKPRSSINPAAVFLVLLVLFVSGGIVDTCMKIFDEVFASRYPATVFLVFVYLVAAGIGTVVTIGKFIGRGTVPSSRVLAWGLVLGLCNYGATLFFLRAVARLAAPFVFPANSIAIVLGAALLGVWIWGEQLSRLNWLGLGMAAAALVLLRV